jgi:hypothetical protein
MHLPGSNWVETMKQSVSKVPMSRIITHNLAGDLLRAKECFERGVQRGVGSCFYVRLYYAIEAIVDLIYFLLANGNGISPRTAQLATGSFCRYAPFTTSCIPV